MFSVIMPVYNKLPHLERSINSVLNQTFEHFELILIDDASTDGSSQKIKTFKDDRIRLASRSKPGPGGYAARNVGIEMAKYDWIAFLDADDAWNPQFLATYKAAISTHSDVQLFSSKWKEMTEKSALNNNNSIASNVTYFSLKDYLIDPTFLWTDVAVVHKKLIQKVGGFHDAPDCTRGGDVATWVKWLNASVKNAQIDDVLAYYYRDTVNTVTSRPNLTFCAYDKLMEIYKVTSDRKLKQAIRNFVNRFIYYMLARQVRAGMKIDYRSIKKMFLSPSAIARITKLHIIKLKRR